MVLLVCFLALFAPAVSGFGITRHRVSTVHRKIERSSHPCSSRKYYRRPTRMQASVSEYQHTDTIFQSKHITFASPLLEDGYPSAVNEYNQRISQDATNTESQRKPLLLYLPGFDGTILAPFVQFPSLGESFDVRGMKVGMDNRSTFDELKSIVLEYISVQSKYHDGLYLMGESFGGIMAVEVARHIQSQPGFAHVQLKGLTLVNPATSYLRSALYKLGPPIANQSSMLPPITFIQYITSLITQLVPLFLDEGKAFQQLMLMLSSKGLPAVLNTPAREAYLGRIAFDLANRLKFMPQDTLKWRLEQWLERGCTMFENRLNITQQDIVEGLGSLEDLRTLIVVGEIDLTLPSVEEAERLTSKVFNNAKVHVVEGAGHASTCGSSVNIIQLMRDFFPELKEKSSDTRSYEQNNKSELFGLVPRYDNAVIGMSPLLYWDEEYYRQIKRDYEF